MYARGDIGCAMSNDGEYTRASRLLDECRRIAEDMLEAPTHSLRAPSTIRDGAQQGGIRETYDEAIALLGRISSFRRRSDAAPARMPGNVDSKNNMIEECKKQNFLQGTSEATGAKASFRSLLQRCQ